MSQAARNVLKSQQGGTAVAEVKDPIGNMLEKLKPQLAAALPKHMNPDRMARVVLTDIRMNPKLGQADPKSLIASIVQASQLGLEPGNGLGHCYLLPFEKRAKQGAQWVTESIQVQLIVGYRGMIDLARRSGQIENIFAVEVYQGEEFEVSLGLEPNIVHKRDLGAVAGPEKVIAVYAVAKLKDGGTQFEVMSRNQVEEIRKRSKAKDNGPWVTDWAEMAKKTVVRRLFKYLPVSIELAEQLAKEDQSLYQGGEATVFDFGTGTVIQGEAREMADPEPAPGAQQVETPAAAATTSDPSLLKRWMGEMDKATTVEALDEVYIRAEGDLDGVALEEAVRHYRTRKSAIESGNPGESDAGGKTDESLF